MFGIEVLGVEISIITFYKSSIFHGNIEVVILLMDCCVTNFGKHWMIWCR